MSTIRAPVYTSASSNTSLSLRDTPEMLVQYRREDHLDASRTNIETLCYDGESSREVYETI
jgi:hypothetical protein